MNCKMSSGYREQSERNKVEVNKVGLGFYWIYEWLRRMERVGESPMFGVRQVYK